jgi:hypothetical protein
LAVIKLLAPLERPARPRRELHAAEANHGVQLPAASRRRGRLYQCMAGARLGRTGASIGARLLVGSPGYLWASALLASGQATLSGCFGRPVRHRAHAM